jgi:hypothetical protein
MNAYIRSRILGTIERFRAARFSREITDSLDEPFFDDSVGEN